MNETTPTSCCAYTLVMRGMYTSSLMVALNRFTTAESSACGWSYEQSHVTCGCGHLHDITTNGIVFLEGFN